MSDAADPAGSGELLVVAIPGCVLGIPLLIALAGVFNRPRCLCLCLERTKALRIWCTGTLFDLASQQVVPPGHNDSRLFQATRYGRTRENSDSRAVTATVVATRLLAMPLQPGTVSPIRVVPASIPRPEYVGKARVTPYTGPEVKDAETIERMRIAGRLAAQALAEVGRNIVPGVTTDELDRIGHEFLCDHNAYPSTLEYPGSGGHNPYPKSLCTSLNECICHGIPDSTIVEDGDIVNIDITAFIGGVHGDTNATFLAGNVDEESRLLVERTHEATIRAIKAVAPGRSLSVVGRVIESYAKRFGYGVVRDFTGHGIGTAFHSGLVVPHYDDPNLTLELEVGMTFTIEPMLTLGTIDYDIWDDSWTVVTRDGKRTAQFEHTILVTETGSEILTLP